MLYNFEIARYAEHSIPLYIDHAKCFGKRAGTDQASSSTLPGWKQRGGLPLPIVDENVKVLNYFGVWHEDIESRIVSWLESNGVSSSFPVEPRMTVRGFLSSAVDQRQLREELAVGISVRIQRANNKFDLPRPHHHGDDVPYWNQTTGEDIFKYGTDLLGPGTIFCQVPSNHSAHRSVIEGVAEKQTQGWSSDKIREWLTQELADIPSRQLQVGEIAKWRVGTSNTSAIHSEPPMSDMPEGRIFITLVPGTHDQIKGLASAWGIPYGPLHFKGKTNSGQVLFN